MKNVQVTSESELLKGLAFPKNKNKSSLEKYRKRKSIPDLWDSTFTPKLPALPCLALPPRAGILPAQQSTQKPKVVLTALSPNHFHGLQHWEEIRSWGSLWRCLCFSPSLFLEGGRGVTAEAPLELQGLEVREGGSGTQDSLPGGRSSLTASSFPSLCRLGRWGGIWQCSRGKQVMKCVEPYMQQTEKQVNKHQIKNKEHRNTFSYQMGAQTSSIRKPRMPET